MEDHGLFSSNYFELDTDLKRVFKRRLAILIASEYEDLTLTEEFDGTALDYFIEKQKEAEEYELYGTAQAIKEILNEASERMDRRKL